MSTLIRDNEKYKEWIQRVSREFKNSQIRASVHVNEEMLRFYWALGRDLSEMSKDAAYGSGFYKAVSTDLQNEFPDVRSFSPTNLKYMRYFYELYPQAGNGQQLVDHLPGENRQQFADDFNIIFKIPWGHHIVILNKFRQNRDKALFYVKKTIENNWSRAVLLKGKAISNFQGVLPASEGELAQQITRDPYNFDFLTLREDYDEKELKDALMDNIQKFLLELGKGFAFVGREYRIEVGSTEQFIDMLFYNIILHCYVVIDCYVVIEVKVEEFQPRDMGQTSTYVSIVDGMLKREGDNPTIGLLICKTKDNVLAQYAVNSVKNPIGISEYELSNLLPTEIRETMPTIEEIENELSGK